MNSDEAQNRSERARSQKGKAIDRANVEKIVERLKSYPVVDDRPAEELLGYDEHGLPR